MTRFLRAQDFVWLLLFSALAVASPSKTPATIGLLFCLGMLQVLEPKIPFFSDRTGVIAAILMKLLLCYLLIGFTQAINSSFYVFLLLPVVSAATTLGLLGTTLVTVLAFCSYLSFLFFLDWGKFELSSAGFGEVSLRVIFLSVFAFLTYQLAEQNRIEARRNQIAAQDLAKANESLQEAEAAVRRSDRLAALGQLTAGLAHELRNPLGTMRASAEMLVSQTSSEGEVARELASFIASEVDRINSLITRFLDFARPMHLRIQKTDVTEILDQAIAELGRHNPPLPVSCYKNYAPGIPRIEMDGEWMERVFYNLLLNAAQATAAGGAITVKTRWIENNAEISIIDRGSGIAPEHLENIFNPFFTTKSSGVGLGLAIVSKIVDEHGGKISVESEPGDGTVFRVYLPAGASTGSE